MVDLETSLRDVILFLTEKESGYVKKLEKFLQIT